MLPLIGRVAVLLFGGRVVRRIAEHPRVAPIVGTRKGRLLLFILGFGLTRHPKTRVAGKAIRQVRRLSRRA